MTPALSPSMRVWRAGRTIAPLPGARLVRTRFDLGPGFAPGDPVRLMGVSDGLVVLQSADGRVAHAHPDTVREA